jgi:hypothetical protein
MSYTRDFVGILLIWMDQSVSVEVACDSKGIKPVIHHGGTEDTVSHASRIVWGFRHCGYRAG